MTVESSMDGRVKSKEEDEKVFEALLFEDETRITR
jgi:hypothetical protein